MVSFISKFLFTATVTAPTFLSLGLIGVIKDSTNYFQLWDDMLENKIFPTSFEWWGINISFGFMLICLIGIKIFLYRKSNKHKEGKTIQVKSYSNLSLNSAEQIISSIIPWLTIFADKLDFMVLFVCIILQCCFIAIASYQYKVTTKKRNAERYSDRIELQGFQSCFRLFVKPSQSPLKPNQDAATLLVRNHARNGDKRTRITKQGVKD